MRYLSFYVFMICFLSQTLLNGQNGLPPKDPYPIDVKQIHSGHSLTDPLFHPWPGLYVDLVTLEMGSWAGDLIGKSTVPGSTMQYRWENPPGFGAPDARHDIDDWELLSITERVPLYYEGGNSQEWYLEGLAAQRQHFSLFVNNAWNNGNGGNGAPTLLWTTWTNIDNSDGPWRSMLDILGTEWEYLQDYANENKPAGATHVYIIPGHKMMAWLYDDIQLGVVPGITQLSQFFSDNIHVNDLGAYAVAMIHYACIYNTSPVGLPAVLNANSTPPSPALALYLQTMIWDVVTGYERTGLNVFLNVDRLHFEAQSENANTVLKFSFEPSPGLTSLEIQHSSDQIDFETINRYEDGLDKLSQFTYVHKLPAPGANYYRLKFTGVDGKITYSPVRTVLYKSKLWNIYPNPAKDVIYAQSEKLKPVSFLIKDLQGRMVKKGAYKNGITVDGIIPGVYLLELSSKGGHQLERIVIGE